MEKPGITTTSKKAVGWLGPGCNLHSPPEVAAVRRGPENQGTVVDQLSAYANPNRLGLVAGNSAKCSEQKRDATAEGLGGAIHQLGDQTTHSEARHIQEVGGALAAFPIRVANATGVDPLAAPRCDSLEGAVQLPRNLEGPEHVSPGPQGQRCHLGVVAELRAQETAHHLAGGAVTAGHDNALDTGADALPGDPLGIPGSAGPLHLEASQGVAKPWLQGRKLAPGRAASAARIHHHECAHGHRRFSLTGIAREARGRRPADQAAYWISGGGAIWYRVRTAET